MSLLKRLLEILSHSFSGLYLRQKSLSENRRPYTRDEFVGFFAKRGVADEISSEIWDALIKEVDFNGFTPYPEDNLLREFGLVDDEHEYFVLEILERLQCRVPPPSETLRMPPVNTVTDLVEFVALMKRTS